MKNNDNNEIKQGRAQRLQRALPTDILVIPKIVEQNHARLAQRPRRKRRINYAKKISNDEFIFNV